MKQCNVCQYFKKEESFYSRPTGTLRAECKECKSTSVRRRQKRDTSYRKRAFMTKYKIDASTYDLVSSVENCEICGKDVSDLPFLCVDHCHTEGGIRGVLCRHCNSGLGFFSDNEDILRAALSYIKDRGIGE
jgi:hypothetical protein